MRPGLSSELRRIIGITVFCLFFGVSAQATIEVLLLGCVVYLLWSLRMVLRLFAWVDGGMRGSPPDSDGVWGEISDTLNRQRRRHRRAKEKMRQTITRTMRMTEALDEGMLVLNSDRSLDWWNYAAESLVGLRSLDRGTAIINLIRDPAFVTFINEANFSEPLRLASANQSGRLLEFSGSHFGRGEVVLIVTDITRLHGLERMRKEFVANVSHELRTPLTVIRGYIETLKDLPEVPSGMDKAFNNIAVQAEKMQTLADDLIVLSKLESEGTPEACEPINVSALLYEIVADARELSAGKHRFDIQCDEQLGFQVSAKDLRSTLGNVIFNAVRHNPRGAKIEINVTEEDNHWNVAIRDDGIGIDPIEIPRITERFYRVDASRNSTSGGTGLGLAIVKHTLNRYGGSLVINSRSDEGAEFLCRWPKAR